MEVAILVRRVPGSIPIDLLQGNYGTSLGYLCMYCKISSLVMIAKRSYITALGICLDIRRVKRLEQIY